MQDLVIDETKLDDYVLIVKDWCLVNGLISLSKSRNKNNDSEQQSHDLALALPVTLHPTKFPAKEFQFALSIQDNFNELIYNISQDYEFLKETLKDVIQVDDFTRRLWQIYEKVHEEGVTQPISLGIFRNDYMLDANKHEKMTSLSQIEINTISCSFGAATSQITRLHRHALNATNNHSFMAKQAPNENVTVLAKAIVQAWKLYGNTNAQVVFLVISDERNIGDQRLLEYKCLELEPMLKIGRYTFNDIYNNAKLSTDKKLIMNETDEIGLVYFRVGYDPKHFSNEHDWEARLMIERSRAIKSPTIQLHLVGAKRIQQALCEKNVLEKFIKDDHVVDKIRATFVDQYSFNKKNTDDLIEFMLNNFQDYVLKPQREGGGNNIYREDIKKFIESLNDKCELMGYILMKLVKPFVNQNYIIKVNSTVEKKNLISEIGIFGVLIAKSNEIILNETGGYLLRTKSNEVNEGGVVTGYSALDSIFLV